MRRLRLTDLLEFIGGLYGDQDEFLVCGDCEREIPWKPESPQRCAECSGTLYVHIPHREELPLRWQCWKGDQKWIPQRYYVMPADDSPSYRYIAWWGREWRKRPWRDEIEALADEV